MSVQNSTARITYVLTATSESLSVPFYFLDETHLKVWRIPVNGSQPSVLTLNSDYSVTGAGNINGGSLAVTGMAVGDSILILRNVDLTQQTRYFEGGRLSGATLERNVDKLTMIDQQLLEKAGRSISYPETETVAAELPLVEGRSDRILSFDEDGNMEFPLRASVLQTLVALNANYILMGVTDYGYVSETPELTADYGEV